MPPQVATVVFALVICVFFALDRDTRTRTSRAMWIAVIWWALSGSRNASEWLQFGAPVDQTSDAYLEGDPIDRNLLAALIISGLIVLIARHERVSKILRVNTSILLYFGYCAVSSGWSEYPDVSIKRWIRSLGDLVVILIILTDADRLAAIKRLLSRVGFLLLPVSILLIRYYPNMGRAYSRWTGDLSWTGVANGKNGLGMICLLFGLASVWRLLNLFKAPKGRRRTKGLVVHGIMVVMALWLIHEANSATSQACFVFAGFVMTVVTWRPVSRSPGLIHLAVMSVVVVAFCALFLGIGLGAVGRDSTLTGRTDIWNLVLGMVKNPVLGTGFESFWLGDRLKQIRILYPNHVNQSHNGYIEIYLNLGWVGIAFLAGIMYAGYRSIVAAVQRGEETASLRLAYFVVTAIYNLTEASFKMTGAVWIAFLLVATIVPRADLSTDGPGSLNSDQRAETPAEHWWLGSEPETV